MINLLALLCLAVWCSVASSQPSSAVFLGTLTPLQHQTSGELYAIDEKTFFIQDFNYDGFGPAVFVYVYLTGQTVNRNGGGTVINWSQTTTKVPRRRFSSEDVNISLTVSQSTAHLNISNIRTFTIWCERFSVFFTRLDLPTDVNIPPVEPTVPPVVPSCVQLHSDFQVSWTHTDSHINIKQCGCISEDQYMAFGISGSNTSTNMVGSDVVVTWINDDGPNAIDYYLTSRQQCRAGQGVCPDTMISRGNGTQDAVNVTGIVVGGMRCIEYTRSLNTSDSNDRPYLVNNQTQFVAWAYGPRATEEGLRDLAFFHTEYPRNTNVELNFAESLRCSEPLQCMQDVVCAWEGLSITALEPTTFTVKIGLSAGLRGYQAITGLSSWGIAYYINDTMAPVLKLRRHVTYTFIVEAGNDPNDGPRYHPFYITDSIDGGILLESPEDRMRKNEQVYAGYNTETNEPTAAGRYCSHEETAGSESVALDCDSTLQDYLDTLSVSCEGDESDAAILTWTPDENTPDVVYYQCANHLHLGWQIVVMNGTTNSSTGIDNNTNTGMGNTTDTMAITVMFGHSSYGVGEDNGPVHPVLVLNNSSSMEFTVQVTNTDGSATGGSTIGGGNDYISGPYTVKFAAGVTRVLFNVSLIDDIIYEGNEDFTLTIDPSSLPTGVTVGNPDQATVTIVDNDGKEEVCSITSVDGKVNHNRTRRRTRFRFSSDGKSGIKYQCKLDDGKYKNCKSPRTWRNLRRGRHTITVRAFCVDDEGKRFSTVEKNFKFRVR